MEDQAGAKDSRGHANEQPRELAKMWCYIRTLSGQERISFQQLYPTATLEIVTNYRADIQPEPDHWLEFGRRRLEIVSVENVEERNREWKFLCSEQVLVRNP